MIFHHKSHTRLRRGPPCDLPPGPSVKRGWDSRPHLHRPQHPVREHLRQHFVQRQRHLGSPIGFLPQGVGRKYGWQAGGRGQPVPDRMSQFANSISLKSPLPPAAASAQPHAAAGIGQSPHAAKPMHMVPAATHGDLIAHAIVCLLAQRRGPRSSRPCIASTRLRMSLVSHSTHEKDSRVRTHMRPSPNRHMSHARHAPEIPTPARVRSSSRASRPAPDMTCAACQRLSVT
ncbi:protein serine threonine phosphatases [Striga asiatica]|uniref:Protein serine threonine phosphatases n=1 Tax=Striga asiatica TaxID=4170 RepID=A0A5A7Q8W9_STRAF|nr:protein serine threonine phosphatases [Striga asiatica]